MNIGDVQNSIEVAYGFNIESIKKIKNVYRIKVKGRYYCFKVIKYKFGHFLFILSAMKHLQKNGFEYIPKFIKSVKGEEYIELDGKYAYLTEWMCSRECNYDNPLDIKVASEKLAELHKKSIGFQLNEKMRPRVGWNRWIEIFLTRRDEILDFKRRIIEKQNKSEFDIKYFNEIEKEIYRCERAVDNLKKSDYRFVMKKEITKHGFCHHDYANHNVLICNNGDVSIIDFDYCMLDSHLHDLASLLIRRMKNGKWSMENAKFILDCYNDKKVIYNNEIPIMSAFIEFPQAFWQVGIQYYWEEQPWGEEFFLKKLQKILVDREERQEFVNEFKLFKL
ncbi:CotS family spore coat protein [Oceanirhabdus sp. W0125-5]|uniref:CotS family spore coat protein n=1 Tax=Oceanirhabdus sp. W0125-5 TaxID=2999116 RepID=UPI0022F2BAC5|nr:CotS family spore coat protein [Oceanirhabdus sp. W0125-5]WBW98438.1 CotS family spore coat protein [Oceanirhabdus sp. W0125-5]